MARIAVTSYRLGDSLVERLEADGHEVIRALKSAEGSVQPIVPEGQWDDIAPTIDFIVSSAYDMVPRELIRRCTRLRAIVSLVIGLETVDLNAAREFGVLMTNGAMPENYLGVSESTVMLAAALLLELPRKMALMVDGEWDDRLPGRMLRHRTVGLVGYGATARGVAERLQGWDVNIIVSDPFVGPADVEGHVEFVEFDELLARSDVVSLHVPLNNQTRRLISARELRLMGPGACLINTSRGGVVDEYALMAALSSGVIASAALDVTEEEPLPLDSPLREVPNLILTPHVVGHSHELYEAVPETAYRNLKALISGRRPDYLVAAAISYEDWQYKNQPLV